jgi:SAM-dependent methyltransferase
MPKRNKGVHLLLDRIRWIYRDLARSFPEHARNTMLYENEGKHLHEIARIIEFCPEPARILDIGGGVGVNLLVLVRLGLRYDLFLLDRFEEYTDENRMGSAELALRLLHDHHITVLNQDFLFTPELPYENLSFDGITCFDVIEHLPCNPLELFSEIRRILKPRGTLLVGVPNATSTMKRVRLLLGEHPYIPFDPWCQAKYFDHFREYTPEECVKLLQMSGFEDIRTEMVVEPIRTRARNSYWRGRLSGYSARSIAVRLGLQLNYLVDRWAPPLRASVYCYANRSKPV